MVIYLDTSALLKLYVTEEGRELVREAVASAATVVTSTVTYAEARAGLARRMREADFTSTEHRAAVLDLDKDWGTFARLPVLNSLAVRAGDVAQQYALRGCDAIHLASALHLVHRYDDMRFLGFDSRLLDAARSANVPVYGEN